ncbi:FAD-dependent monooxygenase [Streptomyces sp. NBC_00287]|uniref:FAD-dependent monooxygenase n=1 Tax=Streptomyces sp. NBC_00287 TaxID=2975702 RepID=UPI002E2E63E0|nr:FAD-dependent monooxygenase [Streptomyces sp. NBC_00287]
MSTPDRSTPDDRAVLVVGAGPVGLTAAAELARRGTPVRLVDRTDGPSPLTKALMVWPRTLEVFRGLGAAAYIDQHGLPVHSFRYNSGTDPICDIVFGDRTRPMVIIQPDVEELLHEAFTEAGGKIEWRTELTRLSQDPDGVLATLRAPDGTETTEEFAYVIGGDGASSTVRKSLGIEFKGATYPNVFILADTEIDGDLQRDAVHYYCTKNGIMVLVPLYNGRFRVFTAGPPGMRPEDLTEEVLQDFVDKRGPGGLKLYDVSWQTTFSIHARHAERFRAGRVFLAGDAAHIHSPAGGQGLNTGVTDAHNLAWKLALVHRGAAAPGLLDSYGSERAAVAEGVVKQAEVQTKAWMLAKRWQIALRDVSARLAERSGVFDRFYSPWLAGLTNHYPAGPAVDEEQGGRLRRPRLRNGHLITDAALRESLPVDRYTLLVTGPRPPRLAELAETYGDLVTVRSAPGRRFSAVLVRPDHYVAAQDTTPELDRIHGHLATLAPAGHLTREGHSA